MRRAAYRRSRRAPRHACACRSLPRAAPRRAEAHRGPRRGTAPALRSRLRRSVEQRSRPRARRRGEIGNADRVRAVRQQMLAALTRRGFHGSVLQSRRASPEGNFARREALTRRGMTGFCRASQHGTSAARDAPEHHVALNRGSQPETPPPAACRDGACRPTQSRRAPRRSHAPRPAASARATPAAEPQWARASPLGTSNAATASSKLHPRAASSITCARRLSPTTIISHG